MPTTQSDDPNEKVEHPRYYNQHASGIETIELIEHLSGNLHSATKYVWRHGLKNSETPLRDLRSARWYVLREEERWNLYDIDQEELPKTEVVWKALARKVISAEGAEGVLSEFLDALIRYDFSDMVAAIDAAIDDLDE